MGKEIVIAVVLECLTSSPLAIFTHCLNFKISETNVDFFLSFAEFYVVNVKFQGIKI